MVGTAVQKKLTEHELICPKKHELNVANHDQVMKWAGKDIDWIIHLSCETDHEYCDANPSNCYFVNTIGTGNMVELAKRNYCPIIYVSTASVFDGEKKKRYFPWNDPNPINHYNRSKYFGEVLAKAYEKHYILRAGWMFGGGPRIDKKFVNKIITKIRRGDKRILVADDCIGSPTFSEDLADAMKSLVQNPDEFGTYNAVNECDDGVSRYEFAKEIVSILKADVEIVPCKIDDLIDEFPCKRTNYEVLALGIRMPHWKTALKGYLDAEYND